MERYKFSNCSPRKANVSTIKYLLCHTFSNLVKATCTLAHCETIIMGSTSVMIKPDLTSDSGMNGLCSRAFIICGNDFCRVEYASFQSTAKTATVHSVWITDQEETFFQQGAIKALAQPHSSHSSYLTPGSLFCIERSNLHVADIGSSAGPRALPRRFPVDGTPSRVIYSSRIGRLIVGFTKSVIRDSHRNGGHVRMKSKRLLFPMLTFIDPSEDNTTKIEPEEASANENDPSSDASSQDLVSSRNLSKPIVRCIGKSGEKILGLLEWFPTENGTTLYQIVINTLRTRRAPRNPTGQILFYTLTKDQAGTVVPTWKYSIKCDDPVYCLAAYGTASLVYCCGFELVLQTYSLTEKRWSHNAKSTLRSRGQAISVRASFIYVTTIAESLLIFEVNGNVLVPRFSDIVARNGLHHQLLSQCSIIMISDQSDTVTGLWQPTKPRSDDSTITLFEAKLPTSIAHFHQSFMKPCWCAGSWANTEAIIGSAIDGSFYQFEIIDQATWRFLRFIQNMAERNQVVCPVTYREDPRRHLEPSTKNLHNLHVDGDILVRLLECGRPNSEDLLREMLDQEPERKHRQYDFANAAARTRRFTELLLDAAIDGGSDGEDDRDLVEVTIDYLRGILRPVL